MKQYLMLLLLLVPSLAHPKESNKVVPKNPILQEILKLNPKVDKTFALKLSNYIFKYSRQFKTDPMISVAIAMQESAFANKNRMGTVLTDAGELVRGITDVGVFQIHVATIQYMGIDVERLKTDIEYQTYWHVKILAEKIKICTNQRAKLKVKPGNEWSCYHSFTPAKRLIYLADTGRHLTRIEDTDK